MKGRRGSTTRRVRIDIFVPAEESEPFSHFLGRNILRLLEFGRLAEQGGDFPDEIAAPGAPAAGVPDLAKNFLVGSDHFHPPAVGASPKPSDDDAVGAFADGPLDGDPPPAVLLRPLRQSPVIAVEDHQEAPPDLLPRPIGVQQAKETLLLVDLLQAQPERPGRPDHVVPVENLHCPT